MNTPLVHGRVSHLFEKITSPQGDSPCGLFFINTLLYYYFFTLSFYIIFLLNQNHNSLPSREEIPPAHRSKLSCFLIEFYHAFYFYLQWVKQVLRTHCTQISSCSNFLAETLEESLEQCMSCRTSTSSTSKGIVVNQGAFPGAGSERKLITRIRHHPMESSPVNRSNNSFASLKCTCCEELCKNSVRRS